MKSRTKTFRFPAIGAIPLALSLATSLTTSAAVIGIDARHGNIDSNLATGGNFDDLRATILAGGNSVVNLTSFTAADLAGLDAVVVKQSPNLPSIFSSQEILDIHSFVGSGHGCLLLAEAGFSSDDTVGNINSLASPFGVSFAAAPIHGNGFTVSGFVPHPVTLGVNSIGLDFYRSMVSITPPALDLALLSGDNDFLAAVNGFNGGGNIVLLGDASLWNDPDVLADRNINFGDNRLLLQNTISFITIPEPSSATVVLAGFTLLYFRSRNRFSRPGNEKAL